MVQFFLYTNKFCHGKDVKGNILPGENLNLLEITSFVAPPIASNPHVCYDSDMSWSVLQNGGKGEKVHLMISSP